MGKIRKISDRADSWEEDEESDMCGCGCSQQIEEGEVMLTLNVGFAEPFECNYKSVDMVLSYTHMRKYRFDHIHRIDLNRAIDELFAEMIADPDFHRHLQFQHGIDDSRKKSLSACECGCRRRIRTGDPMVELEVGKAEYIEGYDDDGNEAIVDLLPGKAYTRKYLAAHSRRIDLNKIRGRKAVTRYGKT